MTLPKCLRLIVLVCSLWVVFALRAHNILALPGFVDESLHIMRGQMVFDFSDARASFLPAKLLLYYYFGLFGLDDPSALWLARSAVALLAPLSAALSFALTRHLSGSFGAGLLVVWLYALAPFMLFFERMALADPFALVFVLAGVWSALHLAQQPTDRRAILTGVLFGLALLAKLTTLPFLAAPPLAMFLWRGRLERRPLLIVAGLVMALMLLPILYAVYQEVNPPENKTEVVEQTLFVPDERSRFDQIGHNVETYARAASALMGAPWLVGVLALGTLALRPRAAGYALVLAAGLVTFIILATAFPTTRYISVAYPLILVALGVGAQAALTTLPSQSQMAVILGVGLLVGLYAGYGAGFIQGAWTDPERLALGPQDEWEYFSNISSGYGLREAAETIAQESPAGPVRVAGLVGQCHSLRFYMPAALDLRLHCPYFPFFDHPALLRLDEWQAEDAPGYVVIETGNEGDLALLGIPAEQTEVVGAFARPDNGSSVLLLRFTAR